jgi:steroid 5-alpha reductase family enzyme
VRLLQQGDRNSPTKFNVKPEIVVTERCFPYRQSEIPRKEHSRMSFTSIIVANLLIALGGMFCLWVVSLVKQDASIIDPCWGLGFVVIAWATALQSGWTDYRDGILVILVSLWGLRLTAYLIYRNHGKGEDRRYTAMRTKHGKNFWWVSLLTVFGLQAVLMWLIALTFQSGMYYSSTASMDWLSWIGIGIWTVGFFFETVGDFQMARFKSRPENAGKVMDQGLWRYTRHPNYFGDFCVWWGLFLIAANANSWWTVFCPALMSFLLLKVSGVSMLESDISERRPGYDEYKKRTSAFFPMPPSA